MVVLARPVVGQLESRVRKLESCVVDVVDQEVGERGQDETQRAHGSDNHHAQEKQAQASHVVQWVKVQAVRRCGIAHPVMHTMDVSHELGKMKGAVYEVVHEVVQQEDGEHIKDHTRSIGSQARCHKALKEIGESEIEAEREHAIRGDAPVLVVRGHSNEILIA